MKEISERSDFISIYNIKFIFLIDVLLKVLITFSFGFFDLSIYPYINSFMQNQANPYVDSSYPNYMYNYYPAFFFELQYFWFMITGDSVFSLRILLNLADMGCFWMMYLIGKQQKNEKTGCILAFIYMIFPLKFFSLFEGKNDFIALFFELCGIYHFLKMKYPLSGLFFGFAINFKMFPIFCLIPIVISLFKEKKYVNIIQYIISILLITLITSIRFLFLDSATYFNAILINTSRPGDGLNYTYFIEVFRSELVLNLLRYEFSFSILFIYEILGLSIIILMLFFDKPLKYNFFSANLLVYMILPIIMVRMDMNSWLWAAPFLIFTLFSKNPEIDKKFYLQIALLLLIFAATLIFSIISKPDNFYYIFRPYVDEGYSHHLSIVFERINGKRAFGLYYYLFLIITGVILIFMFQKDVRFKYLGYLTQFHCLDVINYLILEHFQYISGILIVAWMIFILRNILLVYLYGMCRKIERVIVFQNMKKDNSSETNI